jgi:hypothetical protein
MLFTVKFSGTYQEKGRAVEFVQHFTVAAKNQNDARVRAERTATKHGMAVVEVKPKK